MVSNKGMSFSKGLGIAAAVALLAAAAGPVQAFVIDSTSPGSTYTTNFLLTPGSTDNGGNTLGGSNSLSAKVTYYVGPLDLTNGIVLLTINIYNTTTSVDERITGFGFDTDPAITVSNFTPGSVFDGYTEDTNFPSGQNIQFCAFADSPCSGGSFKDGLQPGTSDTLGLTLSWSGGNLTIDPTLVKFQGDLGSFELVSCESQCTPPTKVPEPSTLAMLGIGLLGLGATRRRWSRFRLPRKPASS